VLKRVEAIVSLIVSHAGAYSDLMADDLETAYAAFIRRLWAGVILAGAVAFLTVLACIAAIAVTWETPARMWTIVGLLGLFSLISICALMALKAPRSTTGILPQTTAEWRKDRLLLEAILTRLRREEL